MNRKIGASGLLLVAVGGLTASGAVSAMGEDLPGSTKVMNTLTANGPTGTASGDILSGTNGDSLSVIKELSYDDQEKIYKDLTTSSWDLAGVFTGKKLTSTSSEEIYKQLSELREKDKGKFDEYMEKNYALNSLVNNWDEKGVKELLDKLNKKDEEGKESSIVYTKEYLVQNPYEALDIAYNNNSNLVGNVDRSALTKKVKDSKKYLGIDSSVSIDSMTFSGIGALVNDSAKNEYSKLLANTADGKDASVSKTLKAKYYAKQGACWAAAAGIMYGVYRVGKKIFDKITGKKTKKVEVTPEDAQEIQDESVYIFTPYDEEKENSESQPKESTPVVKTPGAQKSKIPAAANKAKKSKTVLSKNKKAHDTASSAKNKAPATSAVNNVFDSKQKRS